MRRRLDVKTDQNPPSPVGESSFRTPPTGLRSEEVAERVRDGRTNDVRTRTSRTIPEILRANVFTTFNALLLTLFVIILATGRWQNGLFGLVIIANSAIGIVQEVRAKRTLDRLTVLNATDARVVRDGDVREIELVEIVADDLIELHTGDQVPADGLVTAADGLEIDESLLTGESDPVAKQEGADVRSGSLVVAGTGRFQATAVGADAYATRIAAEAKQSQMPHSELVAGTNRLLRWISLLMVIVAPVLLWSQFRSKDNHGWQDSVTGTVAALVGMVPEGLVLLTSLAFTLATVTLARKQTLVQQLPAVEGLARVDVICLDKTGTLTYGDIVFDRLELLPGASEHDVREALALSASGPEANATSQALSGEFTSTSWTRTGGIPFSSARKWSAVTAEGHGSWVFGAPEMVLPDPVNELQRSARESADTAAAQGNRVLLLACTSEELTAEHAEGASPQLRRDLVPTALAILAERVREDAADTLKYFLEQGVQLRVISGDNPRTVGAVAGRVGIPGITSPSDAIDARGLPDDLEQLAEIVETHTVFGRISPQQKRAVVAALQSRGHVVAMTGDGVNDALALKDADIGIAMGNGSPATRAVAQLVLLDGKFAHLPDVLGEGRRVIANIERAANLFLTKNVYSLVLALIVAVTVRAYPLAPIQLTLISTVTIGFPGAVLALAPNARRYVPGFLRRVLRFAVPIGVLVGAVAYAGYRVTRALDSTAGVEGGRTTAAITVLIISLWTLAHLFLLRPTPLRLLVGAAFGAGGAFVVEVTFRAVSFTTRRRAGSAPR
jgi:cation-transporting P-type ATPase E